MKSTLLLLLPVFFLVSLNSFSQSDKWLRLDFKGDLNSTEEQVFRDSLTRNSFIRTKFQELHQLGYLDPQQKLIKSSKDSLWIAVEPGVKFEWVELRQGNVESVILVKAGVDLRRFSNRPFDFRQVSRLFESVVRESENKGYPFASIRLDSLERIKNGFAAALNLDLGPFIVFDTLKLTGDTKTKPKFLTKFLQIRPGEPFSQKKVTDGFQQVRNLPYIRLAGEPELSFQNEEATLYLPINDRKINSVDGIIGFLPNELEGGKLLVTGQFDVMLYNLGGTGRNYELHWQRFNQFSQNLKIAAFEPLLFGSSIDLGVSFSLLKEDTTFLNRDFRLSFGYRFNSDGYLQFFSRRQAGDLLSSEGLGELTELPEAGDFRFNNYGINYSHYWIDDVFFPRRGVFAQMEFAVGNKNIIQNTAIPPTLYENVIFKTLQYYLEGRIEKHFYFNTQWGLFSRLSGGLVQNDNLLLNDLFRLGGLQSIRGFNENFFFADRYLYINLEPRFYFDTYSYFMIFADMGRIENNIQGIKVDNTFSAGLGLSLETGNGIFNFIYGLGGSNVQNFALNQSKIHFGFTGRF